MPIGGYKSSGTTNSFQRFVFKTPVKAKSIRVAFDKNSDVSPWLSIVGARLVLDHTVTDDNIVPPPPNPGPTPSPKPNPNPDVYQLTLIKKQGL